MQQRALLVREVAIREKQTRLPHQQHVTVRQRPLPLHLLVVDIHPVAALHIERLARPRRLVEPDLQVLP